MDVLSQTLLMDNNTAIDTGGAIHLSVTNLTFFNGNSSLVGNRAYLGGAIYASESKMLVGTHSLMKVSANLAMANGGGLYLMMSKLRMRGHSSYIRNKANNTGGGLHAANSLIIIEGAVYFTKNIARNGGGVSLESNSKFNGISTGYYSVVDYASNRASHFGGALYVADETNHEMCAVTPTQKATSKTGCFSTFNFSVPQLFRQFSRRRWL